MRKAGNKCSDPTSPLSPSHQLLCALLDTPTGTLRAREHVAAPTQAAPQCRRGRGKHVGSGSVVWNGDVTI